MKDLGTLQDFDIFFYYGENDLEIENEADLLSGMIQPKRSMFYYRQEGCGILEQENYPTAISLQVGLRYTIANWSAFRNTQVSDGSGNNRDRRIAISQSGIGFASNNPGELDVSVLYIPFATLDAGRYNKINLPFGRAL